jgi:hypothetical protein
MKNISIKTILLVQSFVLLCGTLFAWSKLIPQISNFQALYGTIFRYKDCTVPNPFLTACFFGSLAFIVALLWSSRVLQEPSHTKERRLRNFLLFCVIFAGSILLYEFADFYKLFKSGGIPISCSPGEEPWKTPCFFGLIFFLLSYITAIVATIRMKSLNTPTGPVESSTINL